MNEPWHTWRDAAKRGEIDTAIRALYGDLNAAVAKRSPKCDASGRCCDFEAYGHRLYVTGLEIAWFLQQIAHHESEAGKDNAVSLEQYQPTPTCPYQIDGLCSTHTIRPLGCRAFFCEPGTEDWQQDTTERFLDRLKQVHVEHGLPYSYIEWRAGLAEAAAVFKI